MLRETETALKLTSLFEKVTGKLATSRFYCEYYKKHGYEGNQINNFAALKEIPTLNWEEVASVPYLERLYSNDGHITKIADHHTAPGLIARSPKDIEKEPLNASAKRPLVYLENIGDSLQWSLWFYTHNILPLIGDENIAITALAAKKYNIDALVVDSVSLKKQLPELSKHIDLSQIKELHIIDTEFDTAYIDENLSAVDVHLHLTLPESGIIATAQYRPAAEHELCFSVVDTVILEKANDGFLLTNLIAVPFPLIRYKVSLPIKDCVAGDNNFIESCTIKK